MPYGSKAGMATPAPMVAGIVNNVSFYSVTHINQTLYQIIHILHCSSGRIVADFVVIIIIIIIFISQLNIK